MVETYLRNDRKVDFLIGTGRVDRKNASGIPTLRSEEALKSGLHLYPYHLQATHEILEVDRLQRRLFCQKFIDRR